MEKASFHFDTCDSAVNRGRRRWLWRTVAIAVAMNTLAAGHVLLQACEFSEIEKLVAADAPGGSLGSSVCIAGDIAVAGAQDDAGGSVYVYRLAGEDWIEQQKLMPSDGVGGSFGAAIACDRDTIVVGAPGADATYVFQFDGVAWTEEQKLTAGDGVVGDMFGRRVSLCSDVVVVGADLDDDAGTSSGSTYVFRYAGGVWIPEQKLTAADAAAGDRFGFAVACELNTVIIGAFEDEGGTGSVYAFGFDGLAWVQDQKLVAGSPAAAFGVAVAIDGDALVVGATTDGPSGSAFVFRHDGAQWIEEQKLTACDGMPGDTFGFAVAIEGDTAVITAYLDDDLGGNAGSAYVFHFDDGTWVERAKLTASDAAPAAVFGYCVDLAAGHMAAGAVGADGGSGAMYLFDLACDAAPATPTIYWTETSTAPRVVRDRCSSEVLVDTEIDANLSQPHGIALDVAGDRMYFTDAADADKIKSARLDGSDLQEILLSPPTTVNNPRGIGLDLSQSKMYWVETHGPKIRRANLDGTGVEKLLDTGLSQNDWLALDLVNRKFYWSDSGNGTIKRASMDGSIPVTPEVCLGGLDHPAGIAIDPVRGKLYWAEAGVDLIRRANLDCTGVEDLLTTQLEVPTEVGLALDVDRGRVYWTDGHTDVIWSADSCDGSDVREVITTGPSPRGIALDLTNVVPSADCGDNGVPDFCEGDDDNDGVPNDCDICSGTAHGECVNDGGCACSDLDGYPNFDDLNDCTSDSCVCGVEAHAPEPVDTPCGDPSNTDCDNPNTCDGEGICLDNYESAGTICEDGFFCTSASGMAGAPDACDGAGGCHGVPANCDDGQFCTGTETCNEATDTCDSSSNPCPETSCNTCQEETDTCFDPQGTPCDDGAPCTEQDDCDGLGACAGTFADSDLDDICDAEDNCRLWNPDQTDCDDNLVGDVCDIADIGTPLPEDRFDIEGTTVSCTSDDDCLVGLNPESQVYCIHPPNDPGGLGTCYVQKNRYVSIDPSIETSCAPTGRRVTLDVNGNGVYEPGIDVVIGWVGEPTELTITGPPDMPEPSPQLLARIVSEASAHYRDWTRQHSGQPWVDATVQVGDCEVSPDHTYFVQAIEEGADETDEASYSEPLVLRTTTLFGDVTGGSAGTPPDNICNFKDIAAVVKAFQGDQDVPKVWCDLQGGTQTPEIPDFSDISFGDIGRAVGCFQGDPYPFPAPCDCPGQACP